MVGHFPIIDRNHNMLCVMTNLGLNVKATSILGLLLNEGTYSAEICELEGPCQPPKLLLFRSFPCHVAKATASSQFNMVGSVGAIAKERRAHGIPNTCPRMIRHWLMVLHAGSCGPC